MSTQGASAQGGVCSGGRGCLPRGVSLRGCLPTCKNYVADGNYSYSQFTEGFGRLFWDVNGSLIVFAQVYKVGNKGLHREELNKFSQIGTTSLNLLPLVIHSYAT